VGCGQLVHVKEKKIINIEGDPDSPISRGRLCPKGAATYQLVTGAHREHRVLYRKPYATEWEAIPLDRAMDMVAERVKKNTRRDLGGQVEGRASAAPNHEYRPSGATLDIDENYVIKKLFTALGVVQVENQARI
jgi:formate dehydrogenase major subunit